MPLLAALAAVLLSGAALAQDQAPAAPPAMNVASGFRGVLLGITLVAVAVFGIMIAVLAVRIARIRREVAAAPSWPRASGRVVRSRTVTRRIRQSDRNGQGATRTVVMPEVVYEYSVGGRDFSSDRITFNDDALARARRRGHDVQGLLARYPVGATVEVIHDPADPSRAVLEPRGSIARAIVGLVAVLAVGAVFAAVLLVMWTVAT